MRGTTPFAPTSPQPYLSHGALADQVAGRARRWILSDFAPFQTESNDGSRHVNELIAVQQSETEIGPGKLLGGRRLLTP